MLDPIELDSQIRLEAFARVKELTERYGTVTDAQLKRGFTYNGEQIHFYNKPRGIFKPKQTKYLLSIKTVFPRPGRRIWYDDQRQVLQQLYDSDEFVDYSFMGTDPSAPSNQWLLHAHEDRVPFIYFLGVSPGQYQAVYPAYVAGWDSVNLTVRVMFGQMVEREFEPPQSAVERKYVLRETKQRIHQATFRNAVISAYAGKCAISGLQELRLLDAAHISADSDLKLGQPIVQNGLPLSKIHHAAFDAHLIGLDADYNLHVAPKLLEQQDGPMLEALKNLRGQKLHLPTRKYDYPDPDRVAERFERFKATI